MGRPPYGPQIQSRYDQLMGRILLEQREYVRAAEYFQRAIKDDSSYNTRNRAWALLRLGMIHDLNKERNKALDCYSRTIKISGGEGFAQMEARKYLKTPYVLIHKVQKS